MTARLRKITIAVAASALAATAAAGWASTTHSAQHTRVVADRVWCC